MNNKWQFLVFGILTGLLISGMVFLITTSINTQNLKFGYSDKYGQCPETCTIIIPTSEMPIASPDDSVYHPLELTGKIELNSATLEELSTLPGIGDAKGNNIIDFREKYGNFESISELLYVPGIGESLFSQLKDLVYISSSKE